MSDETITEAVTTGPRVITLGCRLNTYESEVMRAHADAAGLGDAVIVNTCAVTAEAVRQARQTIRRAARETPDAPVIVTGCAAQIDAGAFAAMPEVTRVIGNHEKMQAATWAPALLLSADTPKVLVNDIMSVRETAAHLIDGMEDRARAYVQVQQGCDHPIRISPIAPSPRCALQTMLEPSDLVARHGLVILARQLPQQPVRCALTMDLLHLFQHLIIFPRALGHRGEGDGFGHRRTSGEIRNRDRARRAMHRPQS